MSLKQKTDYKTHLYIVLWRCVTHLEAKRHIFSLVEVKKNLEIPDFNLKYNLCYSMNQL